MSIIPNERSMGRYLARHDLIERIVENSPPAAGDEPPVSSKLLAMSMSELWAHAKEMGISIETAEN